MRPTKQKRVLLSALALSAVVYFYRGPDRASAQAVARFTGPTSSQPLALSADDSLLVVANPDSDSVTFFDAKNSNARLAEVKVGKELNGVAISPDGSRAYAANTVDGTVSVLMIDRSSPTFATVVNTVRVGTEPYGLALTPAGRKLYVTNARSNTVSVIDTTAGYSVKTINNVGPEPRGIADDAKAGHVTVISGSTDAVLAES